MGRRPALTLVARKRSAFDPGNPIGFRTSRSVSTRWMHAREQPAPQADELQDLACLRVLGAQALSMARDLVMLIAHQGFLSQS